MAVVFQVDAVVDIAVVLQPGLPWQDAAVGIEGLDFRESVATGDKRPFGGWSKGAGGGAIENLGKAAKLGFLGPATSFMGCHLHQVRDHHEA